MKASEYRKKMLEKVKEASGEVDADTRSTLDLAGSKEQISKLIDVINADGASAEKKSAAIDSLNTVSNFSPILRARMPEIVNALRGQMDSREKTLRQRALGTLAAMKDEIAQERLVAQIASERPEEEKLLPTATSIAMLGRDEKALPIPLLRQVLSNPPDSESLIEALRHMPADPDSFDSVKEVMENDEMPLEARAMIPEMACEMSPSAFVRAAREMLKEKGAEHDLAPFLAKGIARVSAPEAAEEVIAAKAEIAKLVSTAPESFKAVATELLSDEDQSSED